MQQRLYQDREILMNAKQSCGIEDRETGMEQWDIYSRMEYKEIRSMIENKHTFGYPKER